MGSPQFSSSNVTSFKLTLLNSHDALDRDLVCNIPIMFKLLQHYWYTYSSGGFGLRKLHIYQ